MRAELGGQRLDNCACQDECRQPCRVRVQELHHSWHKNDLLGKSMEPTRHTLFFICNLRYQTTYVEDGNFGAGSNTTGRVSWLKSLSPEQLQGFLDIGFLGPDRWLDKQP
ncbi:hypothetical protein BHM03_00028701 [Ensete ventricosum]|nr:hypothetical protein BHM03_00028701 [Ensete ventricosum]